MTEIRIAKRRIYVLSAPQFDAGQFLAFLAGEGCEWRRTTEASQAEELVEAAGRICYMSFGNKQSPKGNDAYISHLISSGHESVLEHVSWTFLICGVSRAFSHQLVRHRVGVAFSQLSQQYHDESDAAFVVPPDLSAHPKLLSEWKHQIEHSQQTYRTLLSGLPPDSAAATLARKELLRSVRSTARSVLPNSTETKIVFTANARALRHILAIRGGIPGDIEMRVVMAELLQVVKKHAPAIFADLDAVEQSDGWPLIIKQRLRNEA